MLRSTVGGICSSQVTKRKSLPNGNHPKTDLAEPADAVAGLPCGADRLLRKLWGQWKTHVIYVLGEQQACRFGVLRRTITGISPKVLTQRLRELEADGLVWREQENTIPPKVPTG